MAKETYSGVTAFSSRSLVIPGYSAPLFVYVIDAQGDIGDLTFNTVLQNISGAPRYRIITDERWMIVADAAIEILGDDALWRRRLDKESLPSDCQQNSVEQLIDFYRVDIIRHFDRVRKDRSYLAFQVLSNLLYRASEGLSIDVGSGIPVGSSLPTLSDILNEELTDRLESDVNFPLGRDDLQAWRQVSNFVQGTVSQQFGRSLSSVLRYEIPYGLSPKVKSDRLETLIRNARLVAVFPMKPELLSSVTASTPGAVDRWFVALEVAATSDSITMVILGSVDIAHAIVSWLKEREIEAAIRAKSRGSEGRDRDWRTYDDGSGSKRKRILL